MENKFYSFLLILLFSLSCYSQKRFDVNLSVNKEKRALYVEIKNNTDSVFALEGFPFWESWLEDAKSNVYIAKEKPGNDRTIDDYYPLLPATGEVWYKKEPKSRTYIKPQQTVLFDVIGINEELLSDNRVYVKLRLTFWGGIKDKKAIWERMIVEENVIIN